MSFWSAILFCKVIIFNLSVVITAHGTDVYANATTNLTLKCPFRSEGISWYGPSMHIITSGNYINPYLPNKDRIQITGNFSIGESNLNIIDIEDNDKGQYICRGLNPGYINENHDFNVIINSPPYSDPTISYEPYGAILPGDTIKLICDVTGGHPLANITWQCDGGFGVENLENINTSVSVISLSVDKKDNNKMCTCNASHLLWPTQKTANITINVLYSPEVCPVIQRIPSGSLNIGNLVTLTCSIKGGNPLAKLVWNCSGTLSGYSVGDIIQLNVSFVIDRSYHNKVCNCTAKHPLLSFDLSVQHVLTDIQICPDCRDGKVLFAIGISSLVIGLVLAGIGLTVVYTHRRHRKHYEDVFLAKQ